MHTKSAIAINNCLAACISAVFAFLLITAFGEMALRIQIDEANNKQHLEAVSYASALRARTERELNALLYLSSGLGSYLVVRNNDIQAKEVNDILAVLHRSSRHVRSLGIAIGYRLTFVYPLEGNESALGLYYPDLPEQWPLVQKIAETGQPALAGPVNLVQGGSGLIYRVPLSISGKYWGMLATVIDADSFFKSLYAGAGASRYEFSVRGKDGMGLQGDRVWGDMALFSRAEAIVQEIEIPGGHWAIAVKRKADDYLGHYSLVVRSLSVTLGGVIAWILYMLIRSRSDLAQLAMYDPLTGLPNRNLLEDRARIAFARQRRRPAQVCALLFLDLDGFKDINDRYGHRAGDTVLRVTAGRIKSIVRSTDTVARWGGDEYIILLEHVTEDTLDALMQRLRNEIECPVELEKGNITVGVSIGVAVYPETGGNLDEMLKKADKRMYQDKIVRSGKIRAI